MCADRRADIHLKRKCRDKDCSNENIVPLDEGIVDGV